MVEAGLGLKTEGEGGAGVDADVDAGVVAEEAIRSERLVNSI